MGEIGKFVKLIGFKFDALEGIQIIVDSNVQNFEEAGKKAQKSGDDNMIFVGIPCEYSMN